MLENLIHFSKSLAALLLADLLHVFKFWLSLGIFFGTQRAGIKSPKYLAVVFVIAIRVLPNTCGGRIINSNS